MHENPLSGCPFTEHISFSHSSDFDPISVEWAPKKCSRKCNNDIVSIEQKAFAKLHEDLLHIFTYMYFMAKNGFNICECSLCLCAFEVLKDLFLFIVRFCALLCNISNICILPHVFLSKCFSRWNCCKCNKCKTQVRITYYSLYE